MRRDISLRDGDIAVLYLQAGSALIFHYSEKGELERVEMRGGKKAMIEEIGLGEKESCPT